MIITSLKECGYRSFSLKEESMTISLISADILFNYQRHKALVATKPNAKSTQMPVFQWLATSQLETLLDLFSPESPKCRSLRQVPNITSSCLDWDSKRSQHLQEESFSTLQLKPRLIGVASSHLAEKHTIWKYIKCAINDKRRPTNIVKTKQKICSTKCLVRVTQRWLILDTWCEHSWKNAQTLCVLFFRLAVLI